MWQAYMPPVASSRKITRIRQVSLAAVLKLVLPQVLARLQTSSADSVEDGDTSHPRVANRALLVRHKLILHETHSLASCNLCNAMLQVIELVDLANWLLTPLWP